MSRSNWMWKRGVAVLAVFCGWPSFAVAAGRFAGEDPAALAAEARQAGDAQRGAVLFYQPLLGCKKCHAVGDGPSPLGPDLTQIDRQTPDAEIVRSILQPSATIKKGYETVRIVTADGKTITGLIERRDAERLVLRDAGREGERVVLSVQDIELEQPDPRSMMPEGLADLLTSRQQLLDLIRYVLELRDGGAERARELEPPPSLYVLTIPEYEQQIDHAGMIADLDRDALRRGEAIYNRLCINCHGTVDQPGTLPTAVRFARDRLKNGCDPYSMYQTLTRGFGMMAPQTWMVPQQKYDVIHYIREHFFRPHNPSQYVPITAEYLAGLPKGTTRGPEPSDILPWEQMNYGPTLTATYEVPWPRLNLAYKGIAVRLDAGPGGVAHGHYWMLFEHDTLRMAAAWSGEGFIDWNGINFNGRHGVHPRIVGQVAWANAVGPGWADPQSGSFDDPRLRGRDGRAYGPLPRTWGHYRGLYHCGDKVVFSYTVGQTEVLEQPGTAADQRRSDLHAHVSLGTAQPRVDFASGRAPEGRGGAGAALVARAACAAATGGSKAGGRHFAAAAGRPHVDRHRSFGSTGYGRQRLLDRRADQDRARRDDLCQDAAGQPVGAGRQGAVRARRPAGVRHRLGRGGARPASDRRRPVASRGDDVAAADGPRAAVRRRPIGRRRPVAAEEAAERPRRAHRLCG